MAYDRSYDTDEGAVPAALRRFIRNRMYEFTGLVLFACLAGGWHCPGILVGR